MRNCIRVLVLGRLRTTVIKSPEFKDLRLGSIERTPPPIPVSQTKPNNQTRPTTLLGTCIIKTAVYTEL